MSNYLKNGDEESKKSLVSELRKVASIIGLLMKSENYFLTFQTHGAIFKGFSLHDRQMGGKKDPDNIKSSPTNIKSSPTN